MRGHLARETVIFDERQIVRRVIEFFVYYAKLPGELFADDETLVLNLLYISIRADAIRARTDARARKCFIQRDV